MRYEPRKPKSFRDVLKSRAREMRQEIPLAEKILWSKLRGDQFHGLRFRRQKPIGQFIADFYCPAAKLVVELDGDSHSERIEYDTKRTAYVQSRGLREVRFQNEDVINNIDVVLQELERLVEGVHPLPSPLPDYRERE
jgi:very-short-patch-repair endonuclease